MLVFVGFNMTFFVMHLLGRNGMPRRVADYAEIDGFTGMNQIATDRRPACCSCRSCRSRSPSCARCASPADVRGRSVGGQLAGVGDVVAAGPPQLRLVAADPLRAAGLRPALDQPCRRRRARHAGGVDGPARPRPALAADPRVAQRRPDPPGDRARRGREARDPSTGRTVVKLQLVHWAGVAVYFAVLGLIYLASGGEAAGVSLLFLASAFGGLVAGWMWSQDRELRRLDPQDDADADVPDDVGVVGVYPTASLRPLAVAVGMTGTVLGVVLGSWMTMAGLAIVASQVALLVRDLDRGR